MKKIFLFLLFGFCAAPAFCAPAVLAQAELFAAAVDRRAAPAVTLYQPQYKNNEEKLIFAQAFNFLEFFPPKNRKNVFALLKTDAPRAHIYVQIDTLANLRAMLKQTPISPDDALPQGVNGVTVPMTGPDGTKALFVLIASDKILGEEKLVYPLSQSARSRAIAKLSALMAHEIYGHAYLFAFDGRKDIPRAEQEEISYGQSADFMDRLAANANVREHQALLKEILSARDYERQMQRKWAARR